MHSLWSLTLAWRWMWCYDLEEKTCEKNNACKNVYTFVVKRHWNCMYGYYVLYSVSKERERVGRDLKYHSPFAKRGERQTLFDILVNFRCTSFFGCSFPFLTPLKKCAEQNQRSPKILLLRISWSLSIDFPKSLPFFPVQKKVLCRPTFEKAFQFSWLENLCRPENLLRNRSPRKALMPLQYVKVDNTETSAFFLPSLCDHFLVSSSATARLMCFFFFGHPAFPFYVQRFQ